MNKALSHTFQVKLNGKTFTDQQIFTVKHESYLEILFDSHKKLFWKVTTYYELASRNGTHVISRHKMSWQTLLCYNNFIFISIYYSQLKKSEVKPKIKTIGLKINTVTS